LKDNVLYVASLQEGATDNKTGFAPAGRFARYDATTGAFLGNLTPPPSMPGQFNPRAVVFGPDGRLYATAFDSSNLPAGSVLQFYVATGIGAVLAANDGDGIDEPGETRDLHRPEGLTFGPDGQLYVTSFRADAADTDKVLIFAGSTQVDRI